MALPIYNLIFYVFAFVLIASATMVVVSRNPVRAILFLILAFFASAVLWMLLQAEFLSLVLIFVYVGAVMTLFLFVIMMLNIDLSSVKEKFVRYLPYGILVMVLLVGAMLLVVGPRHLNAATVLPHYAVNYSNTQAMGTLLFTKYLYAFEIAAAILLVAIIAAISLAFHGRKPGTKSQVVSEQHRATKQDRLRIVKMKTEKK